MTIGERIRQIRKENGLTLDRFGERIGLRQSIVSMMEKGKSKATDQTIRSICREFGVREAWLRHGEEPARTPKAELRDSLDACLEEWGLAREFRGLFLAYRNLSSEEERAAVRQFIREAAEEIAAEEEREKAGEEREEGDENFTAEGDAVPVMKVEETEEERMQREAREEAEEYYRLRLEEKRAINSPEAKRAGTPRSYGSYNSADGIA